MAELLLSCQVLEPNWHVLRQKMQSSAKVDELMAHHNDFLDTSLKASRDAREIRPRYARDTPEMCPRYARDTREVSITGVYAA